MKKNPLVLLFLTEYIIANLSIFTDNFSILDKIKMTKLDFGEIICS